MKTISDIMSKNVISIKDSDNLHHARMLLQEHNIRHLPVISEVSGKYLGLLEQKDILNNAFHVVENYGFSKLKKREENTKVKDVMSDEVMIITSDSSLIKAGQLFANKTCSCLPVIDDGQCVGVLTSVDFVKLSLYLMEKQ